MIPEIELTEATQPVADTAERVKVISAEGF